MNRILALLLLVALGATPCAAEYRLRLVSGQVLEGTDVRREGGNYYLTMMDGGVIPIPFELVAAVELTGEKKPPPEDVTVDPTTGLPSGLTPSSPQQLAGEPVAPRSRSEQAGVLGESSKFQQGVFDPYWHPESDWKNDPTDPHRNDFAPSKFQDDIIDPDWVPENAYPDDHTDFAPSEFKNNIIDPSWVPEDAFKKESSVRSLSFRRFMTEEKLDFSASYRDGRALSRRCRNCTDRLTFTSKTPGCRPINENLSLLLGIDLSEEQNLKLAASASTRGPGPRAWSGATRCV